MIRIGNFFFKYRNFLFIILYLALFLPSPPIFSAAAFGPNYYWYPLVIGLVATVLGQLIRGITISLAYIIRGGKDKQVYAERLVTDGIFSHCRNPLYVGNILMLAGVGVLVNSLIYIVVVMPIFLFIYQAIVMAEENFLRDKFGKQFDDYTKTANRWLINPIGLTKTISGMHFFWKRWLIKEYNTQVIWLVGITIILFFKYTHWSWEVSTRNYLFVAVLLLIGIYYIIVRYQKKSGRWASH